MYYFMLAKIDCPYLNIKVWAIFFAYYCKLSLNGQTFVCFYAYNKNTGKITRKLNCYRNACCKKNIMNF